MPTRRSGVRSTPNSFSGPALCNDYPFYSSTPDFPTIESRAGFNSSKKPDRPTNANFSYPRGHKTRSSGILSGASPPYSNHSSAISSYLNSRSSHSSRDTASVAASARRRVRTQDRNRGGVHVDSRNDIQLQQQRAKAQRLGLNLAEPRPVSEGSTVEPWVPRKNGCCRRFLRSLCCWR